MFVQQSDSHSTLLRVFMLFYYAFYFIYVLFLLVEDSAVVDYLFPSKNKKTSSKECIGILVTFIRHI